jgi:hypothetical protein
MGDGNQRAARYALLPVNLYGPGDNFDPRAVM